MARKVSSYPRVLHVSADDLLLIVDDPEGIKSTKTVTMGQFFSNVNANVSFTGAAVNITGQLNVHETVTNTLFLTDDSTPASSSSTVGKGRIWADSDYIYVATADNTTKRVQLVAF